MSNKKFLNKNGNPIYIMHFPGRNCVEKFQEYIDGCISHPSNISDKISIISVMNKECEDISPIKKQCDNVNKTIFNSALEQKEWDNTLKIPYILECLKNVNTDYVLILDGRDVCISNDLDQSFLDKFENFNCDILFNGTTAPFPKEYSIESLQELLHIQGRAKYLNAGVCIGRKQALIDFYTFANEIRKEIIDNRSEQLIIRIARKYKMNEVKIDHEELLFRVCHTNDTKIVEIDDNYILN